MTCQCRGKPVSVEAVNEVAAQYDVGQLWRLLYVADQAYRNTDCYDCHFRCAGAILLQALERGGWSEWRPRERAASIYF